MKTRRERALVENPTRRRALSELGVPSAKLNLRAGADTGMPDVLYFIPGGKPLLHEYKWGSIEPEPKQSYTHDWLRGLGYVVEVHNNVEEALQSIRGACTRANTENAARRKQSR